LTDAHLDALRARYENLIDPQAADAGLTVAVDADEDLSDLRDRLRRLFADHPGEQRVLLMSGSGRIGIADRRRVLGGAGHLGAGQPLDPGSGDGASLPGHPGYFRVLEFACTHEGCQARELRVFYDDRYLPECGEAGHGRMTMRR
jgi:hypothetical protein